jgi:exopolyphosphatase/guanosine-5'-triphosphate,3'-diphosphate pyrophosphatase
VTSQNSAFAAESADELSSPPLAVVDLGSNSFQLMVANFSHGQLMVMDRLREMVRLAAGLNAEKDLDEASQLRALECLARFGERLRDVPPGRVRVVATNTLRRAKDPAEFLGKAEALLGHEINIISGIEEARLIYVGVSRTLPVVDGKQLVVDIGGGSTEIALGEGFTPEKLESLYIGCVGLSQRFFKDGKLSRKRFNKARTAAQLELRLVAKSFRRVGWQRAAGASGTIRAAASVLTELGWMADGITLDNLEALIELMIKCGNLEELDLPGLSPERAPVFPGGIAILAELMRLLKVDQLTVTQGALREGVLYDLLGRLGDEDSRLRTVRALEHRYHVDQEQADRVELTALALLDQVAANWGLERSLYRQVLGWAARVHEVGLEISHAQYHRHSAYLLQHADLPGFNRDEQRLLACLAGSHRRKFSLNLIRAKSPPPLAKSAARLAILLRLAVLFNRSRSYEFPDALKISAERRHVILSLTDSWLQKNPLTLADLELEQGYLAAEDITLELRVSDEVAE